MRNESIIKIEDSDIKIFFQYGFYKEKFQNSAFHKHLYTEIHSISSGYADLYVDGKIYSLKEGNVIAVPAGKVHKILKSEDFSDQVFQTSMDIKKFTRITLPVNILKLFSEEIQNTKETKNFVKVNAYLTLICSYFYQGKTISEEIPINYGFAICEFFASGYTKDISVSDLAEFLHLSKKQTERIVMKYTGRTFRQEIIARRKEIAEHLLKTHHLSRSEIASLVGYNSYSGFWKTCSDIFENKKEL